MKPPKAKKAQTFAAILRHLKASPTFESIGVGQYRTLLEKSAKAFKVDPATRIDPVTLDHVSGAWITPDKANQDHVILYLHGGGFMGGSINTHKDLGARIAAAAGARLLMPEYRLAPEHPFPAGLTDVVTACTWLLDHHVSPDRLVVAGDSAGGGLTVSLLLKLKEKKIPLPRAAVLISPWADLACTGESHQLNLGKDPMLNKKLLVSTAANYVDKARLTHPLVSPVHGDLSGLCPLLIQVGSHEVLLDDSITLGARAKEAGVEVTLEVWEEMFHVWHYFARYLDQSRDAIDNIGEWIKNKFLSAR
ncbi:MAG: alpha/beta hydrolase [Desulfobacteraceae bacterium]|nr:alpha/beta hydrolase [Desulfobacteraceae bacterium]